MSDFLSNLLGNLASAAIIALVAFLFRERLKRWWTGTWSPEGRFFRRLRRDVRRGQHPFTWRCFFNGHDHVIEQDSIVPPDADAQWRETHPYVVSICSHCGDVEKVPR